MEVDEMLFEAFAPKRLKNVLEHGKTIELKPLRRVFGLDLAPVLKLLLTSTMLGLMVGFSIAPQTEYLIAAGDAMCGTCGQCCRARPPAPHGAVRPGLRRWSARLGVWCGQGAAPFAYRAGPFPCRAVLVPGRSLSLSVPFACSPLLLLLRPARC